MKFLASLLIATFALAGTVASPRAQQPIAPIDLKKLPHITIISPVFYWTDTGGSRRRTSPRASATCRPRM